MKSIKRIGAWTAIAMVVASLSACEGMSRQGRDTAVGAGLGAAAGAAIGGNALSTVGGAAAGGVIGHEVGK
ncbi:glycine zipper 2TM domain-containing protein [Paraburkholderia rhizosphaerae]|uniref:Osmotically inducible lipoprotein OsmB n=1 Tax=Paraburkholderia rhizosphaerae TaxID=480658 RepID=A0A4R8LJN8_9BURK|nr:glycine zipper 2TM domain-containing protein [Paraburkholderia rhizosphaerae]TDY42688.1 osmotically inducible lipoprotein OsmB [Paraburkholderia rhizosphaerae]